MTTDRLTRPAECRSCRAPIVWATTRDGSRMPIDYDPHPDGNVRVAFGRGDRGENLAYVVDDEQLELTLDDPTPLRRSHFATCPDADTWRTAR